LFWPGLQVGPKERRGKDNEHRDYGGGNKYRIGWHGWSPVRKHDAQPAAKRL
jgi:hypothetical protein